MCYAFGILGLSCYSLAHEWVRWVTAGERRVILSSLCAQLLIGTSRYAYTQHAYLRVFRVRFPFLGREALRVQPRQPIKNQMWNLIWDLVITIIPKDLPLSDVRWLYVASKKRKKKLTKLTMLFAIGRERKTSCRCSLGSVRAEQCCWVSAVKQNAGGDEYIVTCRRQACILFEKETIGT